MASINRFEIEIVNVVQTTFSAGYTFSFFFAGDGKSALFTISGAYVLNPSPIFFNYSSPAGLP